MYIDRRLWEFTRGVRLRIAATVALGLAQVAFGIARLALLGWVLGRVFAGAGLRELALPVALTAVAVLARAGLEYTRATYAHRTAAIVQTRLRQRLYEHVVMLGPAHFAGARTGEVLLAMGESVQQLETYFGQYLPQLIVAGLTPVLIFAFVAFLDLPVALVLLAAALVTLIAPALWHGRDRSASRARQVAYGDFASDFLDSIQGLGTLKSFGQSGARRELLEKRGWVLFSTTMWVLAQNTMARGITDAGIAIGAAAALGVGAWRVASGEMPLSVLLVILMLGVEVFRPLRELRVLLHQGMHGLSAAQGIYSVLDARPAVSDGVPPAGAPLAPTVEFEAVTFAYPGGRGAAHDGLTFAVARGERVGIVGPSGSGKSTIARLLLRLHDPQRGRVAVGGHDVRELALGDLRRAIAVVSQDTYLFHGTVEENLRMGKPDATTAELEAAARAANAHEFIARLPEGYRTVVGERGVRLSGGQRQRIAIARALLRDAPILVLDEALSSVDAESEAVIQEALDRLMRGRTTLIFAHRLSSVIGADRILVLDGGRVAESGSHAELMARGGVYHRLMALQARDSHGAGDVVFDALERPAANGHAGNGQPRDETEPAPTTLSAAPIGWSQVIRTLLGLVRPYRGQLTLTFALGVTRVVALIGVGVLSALIVQALKRGTPWGPWLIALAIVAPLAGLLHWLESWLAHDMAFRLLTHMRLDLFRKLDALAPAYLVRRRSGDLVAAATNDVELIEYFFAHTITPGFVAILIPAGVLVTLAVFGWPLALAVLPFLAYAGLSPLLGRAHIDRLGARSRDAAAELNAHAVDSVQGLGEIVAFQQERARGVAFAERARAWVAARTAMLDDLTRQGVFQEAATGLGALAVATTGAFLVVTGRLDGGVLPLLTLIAISAFVPVWEIAQVARQLADTLGAARRLHAVHSEPVPVVDGRGVGRPRPGAPALEMREVRFVYPERVDPALDGVSFEVPAGQTVALVGLSGAGKTTVAALFLRFWDPASGVVRVDGHDARDYKLDELRARIALVAQDTYLFNDTLGNNIRLAKPGATPTELATAVAKASLDEFVGSLPDGLDTLVGELGAQLSGGQRQRVAIARAFLKDAPILILDEATSHLDAVNEAAVRASLTVLARERTTLVIAHRLATVRDADRIVVLDAGRIVETGEHDSLLTRGGLYARLVGRQLAGVAASSSR
jgi:ATP-binding cassette, subfamily B, bacterial